jgi:hypothetical protein
MPATVAGCAWEGAYLQSVLRAPRPTIADMASSGCLDRRRERALIACPGECAEDVAGCHSHDPDFGSLGAGGRRQRVLANRMRVSREGVALAPGRSVLAGDASRSLVAQRRGRTSERMIPLICDCSSVGYPLGEVLGSPAAAPHDRLAQSVVGGRPPLTPPSRGTR